MISVALGGAWRDLLWPLGEHGGSGLGWAGPAGRVACVW